MKRTIKKAGGRSLMVLLAMLLVVSAFPAAPVTAAGSIPLTVTPSDTVVEVGDEVDFTISMGSAEGKNLFSFSIEIQIPIGFALKSGSGVVAGAFKTATGFADAIFDEDPKIMVSGGMNEAVYSGGPLDIATFTCTAITRGLHTINLIESALYDESVSNMVGLVSPAQVIVKEDIGAQITLADITAAYDGIAKSLTATPTDFGDGGSYAYSYAGTGGTAYEPTANPPANAGTYSVTATYTGAEAFGSKSATITITPKNLTGATFGTITKPYDGTNAATVPVTGLTEIETVDEGKVTATVSGAYADPYVGTGKTVALSDWTLLGDSAGNYSASSLPASALGGEISTAAQTINGAANKTLVINGALDVSAGISASGGGTLSYAIASSTGAADAQLSGTTLTAGEATGTVTIQVDAAAVNVDGDGGDEYTAATPTTFNVSIVDKTIVDDTITFENGAFTYDGTPKSLPAAVSADGSGGTFIYSYAGVGATTYGPTAAPPTNAGSYDVTAAYESAAAIGSKTARLTIEKKAPSPEDLDFTLPTGLQYDASAHSVTATAKAGLTGFGAVGAVSYNGSAAAPVDAGSYAVSVAIAEGDNYSAAPALALGGFTIAPKPLENSMLAITGNYAYSGTAQSPIYAVTDGDPLDADDYTVTNLPTETNAGSYTLTIAGKGNYSGTASQSFVIGKLAPATDNLSFDLGAARYDGAPHAVTVTAGAGKSGLGAVVVKYNGSPAAPTNAGSYAVTADIAAGTNYGSIAGLALGNLVIDKAPAASISRILYVKSKESADYTIDLAGLLPGNVASSQVSAYVISNGASNPVFARDAEIDGSMLTVHMASAAAVDAAAGMEIGFISNNYDISNAVITVNITDKTPVSISAPLGMTKVYDGKPLDVSAVASDPSVELSFSYEGDAYDGTHFAVGEEAPVKAGVYVLTAEVPASDAEHIGSARFGFAIEKAPLTLTADDKSIRIGEALPTYTYSISGLVSPDAKADVMSVEPALQCDGADSGAAAEYAITITGGTLNGTAGANYRIADYANGKLTISDSSGGVPSGGSGGSSGPSSVTVAGGSVTISYARSGGDVTLSLPDAKIAEIIDKSDNAAIFDLSKISGTTSASMPKAALATIAEALSGIEIRLPAGTAALDGVAARSVAAASQGDNVSVSVKSVPASGLSAAQRTGVKQGDSVFDISISSGSQSITSFEGKMEVSVPYAGGLPAGAWSLANDGAREKLASRYDAATKILRFELPGHLSFYVVGQDPEAPEEETSAWANPFADVSASDWFFGDVEYAVTNGLFNGTSANAFSPNATMTRGMIVTVLGRLSEVNAAAYTASGFDDVRQGQYYAAYVEWAKENGIVNGVGGGKFAPDAEVTRQDLAALLARYADFSGKQFPVTLQYVTFEDESLISDYAKKAVETLYCGGIVSGKPGNLFDPKGNATRAETAAVLHRYAEAIK
ncbi:MAG: MBG domain-containing protein [Clostridiales Family XIII bacterium]|nr:MBG domain-containing protein [Clostridiales Family XIII bacterium]